MEPLSTSVEPPYTLHEPLSISKSVEPLSISVDSPPTSVESPPKSVELVSTSIEPLSTPGEVEQEAPKVEIRGKQVYRECTVCRKMLNSKSLAAHYRNVHSLKRKNEDINESPVKRQRTRNGGNK